MSKCADIIIVGGGVIGSSIAYNLLNDGYDGKIIVFEKDPIYEFSSTARSAGGIRQLFTTAVNIEMGKFGIQTYRTFPDDMAINGEKMEINFEQPGYLFLAKNDDEMRKFRKQSTLQTAHGVKSELLNKEDLVSIIPELNIDDLAGGLFSKEDGYLDPYSVMQGYIKQAKQLGASYIYDEVDTVVLDQNGVEGIRLHNDEIYHAPIVINCAGAWAPQLSKKIGCPIPVVPLKRQIIQFDIAEPLCNKLPLTIDPTGVYFRHEGETIISGYSEDVMPGINFTWRRSFFTEYLWPALAERIPNFEQVKIKRGWAGIYSFNVMDQNAIIGQHPKLKGYYLACGFSGHGMQQAPAVGKGMAELINKGKYVTIDLKPLRFERFAEKDLVIEDAIV